MIIMKNIEGVIIPILTPIHIDETPNYEELRKLVDYVIDGGVNAIFANGTTGEFARFTYEESCEILSTIIEQTAGRVPVLAGISDCGTRLVIRNAEYAEAAGADAVVATMPYYFPTTSHSEQIEFIRSLTDSTKLPVLLYNIPSVIGYSLSDEVLDAVYDISNFYGVKDSSGDEDYLLNLLNRYGDKLHIYVGNERLCYTGLQNGASGLVPSLA
ncbi:MAG: dihydrodipicolinate synthase family protein, partial [Angelakisella sp.]|nr:dihydrodipicolinate synthase family protein [Angelakisella sp.]